MVRCNCCGGKLKYHILFQQLVCTKCGEHLDTYAIDQPEERVSADSKYEVSVYTCSKCGKEVISRDDDLGHCSLCGGKLKSKEDEELRRPDYIIPFRKTKEQCIENYKRLVKTAIFVPKEFKDEKYLDKFEGLYLPYWAFSASQKAPYGMKGKRVHTKADLTLTENYKLKGNVNAYYRGLSYGASTTFDNTMGENVAPYDLQEMREFTPGFLEGFTTIPSDRDYNDYVSDVKDIATKKTIESIEADELYEGLQFSDATYEDPSTLDFKVEDVDNMLFPVWLLPKRFGKRVAYGMVNGQTGRAVGDFPCDIRKILMSSLLLGLPMFLLINFVVQISITTILGAVGVMALAACILLILLMNSYSRKVNHAKTAGFLKGVNVFDKVDIDKYLKEKMIPNKIFLSIACFVLGIVIFFASIGSLEVFNHEYTWFTIMGILLVLFVISLARGHFKFSKVSASVFALSVIICAAGYVTEFVDLGSYLMFKVSATVTMVSMFLALLLLVRQYNLFTTRKCYTRQKRGK